MWTSLVGALPAILRGVPPWQIDIYQSHLLNAQTGDFQCLSMSEFENWRNANGTSWGAKLNDNYCDCEDGSDEPGTSACSGQIAETQVYLQIESLTIPFPFLDSKNEAVPATRSNLLENIKSEKTVPGFFCPQLGHVPKLIPHWRVNDLICDCCDGSDEHPYQNDCPNTCAVESKAQKTRDERLSREVVLLKKKRRQLIQNADAQWAEWETKSKRGPDDLIKLQQQLDFLLKEAEQSTVPEVVEDEDDEVEGGDVEDECLGSNDGDDPGCPEKQKVSEYAKWMETDDTKKNETPSLPVWRRMAAQLSHFVKSRWRHDGQEPLTHLEGRPAKANERSEIDSLRDEIRHLTDEIKTAEQAMGNDFLREHHEFIHLADGTFLYTIGEKRTELRKLELSQSEGWHGKRRYFGKLYGLVKTSPTTDRIRPSRFREALGDMGMVFKGGETCGENVTVWLVCGEKEDLILMEEPLPCVHVGVFVTPLACVSDEQEAEFEQAAPRRKRMAGTGDKHLSDEL